MLQMEREGISSADLNQAISEAMRNCYLGGSKRIESYMECLIRQHLLAENTKFIMESVKSMEKTRST